MYMGQVLMVLVSLTLWAGLEACPTGCHCRRHTKQPRVGGLKVICLVTNRVLTTLDPFISEVPTNTLFLDLRGNRLTEIQEAAFNGLRGLKRLVLSDNQISRIEDGAFEGLTKLEKLDLSGNQISSIKKSMFRGLHKLQRLILSRNQIKSIDNGTFSNLPALKRIDFQSDLLVCDCHLQWIVDWSSKQKVRVMPSTKCSVPSSLQGHSLRQLTKDDLNCRGDPELSLFVLSPSKSQLVFEGDTLPFKCTAQVLDATTKVYWLRAGHKVKTEQSKGISVFAQYSADRTIFTQNLIIKSLQVKHTGVWMCRVETDRGNLTKQVSITVIDKTLTYCPPKDLMTNKGTLKWKKTVSGVSRSEVICPNGPSWTFKGKVAHAFYECNSLGLWVNLDDSQCQYASTITRVLEQSTLIPLNESNINTSAKRLLVGIKAANLRDSMDLVFITRNIVRLNSWVHSHPQLAPKLVEAISKMMEVDSELLKKAQQKEKSCHRMVDELESLAGEFLTEKRPQMSMVSNNVATQAFRVNKWHFKGATCFIQGNTKLVFYNSSLKCTLNVNRTMTPVKIESLDENVQGVIQLPSSVFDESLLDFENIQFIVYRNKRLFPLESPTNGTIRTLALGITSGVRRNVTYSLPEPLSIILKSPTKASSYSDAVFWQHKLHGGQGGWSNEGCYVEDRFNNYTSFKCNHLSSFTLIERLIDEVLDPPVTKTSEWTWWHGFLMMEPIIYVSSVISMLCLLATILTYCFCHSGIKMPSKLMHSLVNLCVSIVLLVIVFTMGVNRTDHQVACQIVGISLHYFTITTLFWITITSSNMYKKFVRRDQPERLPSPPPDLQGPIPPKPMLRLYLLGWGIAVIICGITAAVNVNNYQTNNFCFLVWETSLVAFYGPCALLVFINCLAFILIASILKGENEDKNKDMTAAVSANHCNMTELESLANHTDMGPDSALLGVASASASATARESEPTPLTASSKLDTEHKLISQLRALALVVFLFLVTWMFGALSIALPFSIVPHQKLLFSYAYGASCASLGIFIIVFYCLSRDDARAAWSRFFCCTKHEGYDINVNVNTQINMNVTSSNGHVSNSSHVTSLSQPNGHVAPSEGSINDCDSASAFTLKSGNFNLNSLNQGSLKNELLASKNTNVSITQNVSVLEPQLMPIQENFPSFYNPRQNGVARKYWEKNKRRGHSHSHLKLLNKELNTDKNGSSYDGSNDNLSKQSEVIRTDTCTHSFSSNDTNTHCNIDIQITNNQRNKQNIDPVNIHHGDIDHKNIYRPRDLPFLETLTGVGVSFDHFAPNRFAPETYSETMMNESENEKGMPPLPTPPVIIADLTPATEKKLEQIFSPSRETALSFGSSVNDGGDQPQVKSWTPQSDYTVDSNSTSNMVQSSADRTSGHYSSISELSDGNRLRPESQELGQEGLMTAFSNRPAQNGCSDSVLTETFQMSNSFDHRITGRPVNPTVLHRTNECKSRSKSSDSDSQTTKFDNCAHNISQSENYIEQRPYSPAKSETHKSGVHAVENSDNQSDYSVQSELHRRYRKSGRHHRHALGSRSENESRALRKPRSLNWDDQFKDKPRQQMPYVYIKTSLQRTPHKSTVNSPKQKSSTRNKTSSKSGQRSMCNTSKRKPGTYEHSANMYIAMYSDSTSSDSVGSDIWVPQNHRQKNKIETSV